MFNMITNFDKYINEGIGNKKDHTIVIEVADRNDILLIKNKLQKIESIDFDYNNRMDSMTLFPNWGIIDLRWNRKEIYLNYWSDNGNYEDNIVKVRDWMVSEQTDSYMYKMDESSMVLRKVKNYFDIIDSPDYSPRKISKTFEKFYVKGNTLYHYTSIENAIKIIKDNELKYRRYGMHNKYATTMQIAEDYGYISFTEDDEYHEITDTEIPSQCRFVFNIDKLEKDYTLVKYDANKDEEDIYLNDNDIDDMDDLDRQHIPYFGEEMEIRIYEEDIPLTKYLKELELSMDAIDEPLFVKLIELCKERDVQFEEDAF